MAKKQTRKPVELFCVAELNDKGRLVGLKRGVRKSDLVDGAVLVNPECDLPLDGSYKYSQESRCFVPLGHGFGKPMQAPITESRVLYHIARALEDPHEELRQWLAWYETHIAPLHEESIEARRKFARRNNAGD